MDIYNTKRRKIKCVRNDDEFRCENDAINYFKNHIEKFRQVRYKIATECGGIRKDGCVFLENTKEKF